MVAFYTLQARKSIFTEIERRRSVAHHASSNLLAAASRLKIIGVIIIKTRLQNEYEWLF